MKYKYVGTDNDVPDDFEDWHIKLLLDYKRIYLVEEKKSLSDKVKKQHFQVWNFYENEMPLIKKHCNDDKKITLDELSEIKQSILFKNDVRDAIKELYDYINSGNWSLDNHGSMCGNLLNKIKEVFGEELMEFIK